MMEKETGVDLLAILGPIAYTAVCFSQGTALLTAGGAAVTALSKDGVEGLAVRAPLHQCDLGISLARVRVDCDIVFGILVPPVVDDNRVGGALVGGVSAGHIVGDGPVLDVYAVELVTRDVVGDGPVLDICTVGLVTRDVVGDSPVLGVCAVIGFRLVRRGDHRVGA